MAKTPESDSMGEFSYQLMRVNVLSRFAPAVALNTSNLYFHCLKSMLDFVLVENSSKALLKSPSFLAFRNWYDSSFTFN